jgi:addiction module RelB/DinJ family antitoxin
MPEARLSVRVDDEVKRRAENVFRELGMTMSTGINLYLMQVALQRGIPFPLTQEPPNIRNDIDMVKHIEELRAQSIIESKIKETLERGVPVALYDVEKKKPYLEYPDGRREYDIDE